MTSVWPASWMPEYIDRSSVVTMTLAHAVGEQVGDHVGHRVGALDGLAAGHRGVRVDQQLEGDVDVGGRAVADRQAAGVGVGAVAHVLEDVVGVGERRHADPLRAFGAHVVPITTLRFIHMAMVWQPMPADTTLPSGATVELLCGQPEQNQAVRAAVGSLVRAWISSGA